MRVSRLKSFASVPEAAMLAQPFTAPAHPCNYGIPIGIDMRTRKVVMFDPWFWMLAGVTFSTVWEIIGQVEHGKSTLEKVLAAAMLGRWATEDGQVVKTRVQLGSSKSEAGDSEIKPLVDHYCGEMYNLRDLLAINAFDPYFGTRPVELLDTAIGMAETGADNQPLGANNHKALALQIGLHLLLSNGQKGISTPMLEAVTRTITKIDAIEFYRSTNNQLLADYEDALVERPDLRERLNVDKFQPVINEADLQRDAAIVAGNLGRVHGGDFGGLFGGKLSFTDIQKGRFVGLEWGGVPDRARALMQALIWKGLRIASEPGGNKAVVPHMRGGDEAAKSMELLMYARSRADFVRTARAHKTFDLQATQYYSQVSKVGDADTEIRGHAENIQKGIAGRFVFKLPPDDEYGEKLSKQGVSEYDIDRLYSLEKGHCAIIVTGYKPIFMKVVVSDYNLPLIQTNAELGSMTELPVASFSSVRLQKHLQQYGTASLEPIGD